MSEMGEMTKPAALPLAECTVLITGGTSGIGLAAAIKFAESGVRRIAIVGRDIERGENARRAVLERHPSTDVAFLPGDANLPAEAIRLVESTRQRFNSIDVLINSTVGPYTPTPLHRMPIEDIQPALLTMAMGPFVMSRAVLPTMREAGRGVIINISGDAGKLATPGETIIGAAMAAINMFSRTLAIEAKRDGIRVNALTPSLTVGTITNQRMMNDPFASKLFEKARRAAQLGVVVPEDLADMIVFLASPQARRVTGQVISVNGGISAA